jgi:hypothetical protein
LRFIKTDRGTSFRAGSAPLVGRLRLDFFGGLQAAKPFGTAGKANPFRAEFGPTNPPPFWGKLPGAPCLYGQLWHLALLLRERLLACVGL